MICRFFQNWSQKCRRYFLTHLFLSTKLVEFSKKMSPAFFEVQTHNNNKVCIFFFKHRPWVCFLGLHKRLALFLDEFQYNSWSNQAKKVWQNSTRVKMIHDILKRRILWINLSSYQVFLNKHGDSRIEIPGRIWFISWNNFDLKVDGICFFQTSNFLQYWLSSWQRVRSQTAGRAWKHWAVKTISEHCKFVSRNLLSKGVGKQIPEI